MQQEWKWFLVEESIAGISWSQAALRNDLLANPCAEAVSPVTPLPYTRSLGWRNAFLISTYYNSDVRFSGPRLVKKSGNKVPGTQEKKGAQYNRWDIWRDNAGLRPRAVVSCSVCFGTERALGTPEWKGKYLWENTKPAESREGENVFECSPEGGGLRMNRFQSVRRRLHLC